MANENFTVGDLTAVIGDNAAHGEHRAGYNGLWSLTHRTESTNLFVPSFAGFNLEHIFDGQTLDPPGQSKLFFEPRNAPMELRRLSDREAELHQPETPTFHLESWTRFTLVEPDAIDVTFRCMAHQHVFRRGYIGLFWASYINAPDDKSMYFRGSTGWEQHCTPAHDIHSTVRHVEDTFEPTFVDRHRDCLYKSYSPLKFRKPFFYGVFRKHMLMVMFDRCAGIRFSHSPSGGGMNQAAETSNPAWDFQFLVPNYDVMVEYCFRARLVYRERCPRSEVIQEYEKWRASLARK
ncbi:MAG: hypothetical protein NUV77_19130 [Thermoguttaceae bacterium]|jgi:hypothetical protein|nr:hypothetical protein [Thermoguttaceae bacterium]